VPCRPGITARGTLSKKNGRRAQRNYGGVSGSAVEPSPALVCSRRTYTRHHRTSAACLVAQVQTRLGNEHTSTITRLFANKKNTRRVGGGNRRPVPSAIEDAPRGVSPMLELPAPKRVRPVGLWVSALKGPGPSRTRDRPTWLVPRKLVLVVSSAVGATRGYCAHRYTAVRAPLRRRTSGRRARRPPRGDR
jgi:hypothetical protein